MSDIPRLHPLRDSVQDVAATHRLPDTPQTRTPSYRLAFADPEFLTREELRPVRLQLELLKVQMILEEKGVRSTVVLFGGARIPAPERASTAKTPGLAALCPRGDRTQLANLWPRLGDLHRGRAGGDGGGQSWRARGRRPVDRAEHRAAA
jgi:hypothetical protein